MQKTKIDIRRAMKEHNISYAMLSERTGIDKGNVNKLFNGNPTLSKLTTVADAIGIDVTELFYPIDDVIPVQMDAPSDIDASSLAPSATISTAQQSIQTVTFCPHCGAKVRVGVVLMAE